MKPSNQSKIIIHLNEVTNSCFVAMPFDKLFIRQYEQVIRPAIEAAGLHAVRGDEIYERQSIIQDVWLAIKTCRLVVAELSGRNPNVMYEVGLAHAIGKPIVLLTRNEDDVPFDLKALRYIYYDTANPFWGTDLQRETTRLIENILQKSALTSHLEGLEIATDLPETPERPVARNAPSVPDVSGVWHGEWQSVRLGIAHHATLVIPKDHGDQFTASITVSYVRSHQQTVVQESLSASMSEDRLELTAVNYTYIQRGSSLVYTLDSFHLHLSQQNQLMEGEVIVKHGKRSVSFRREEYVSGQDELPAP